MPDTIRNRANLQANIQTGVPGNVTAQDVREIAKSSYNLIDEPNLASWATLTPGAKGTAVLDFGAFPGKSDTSVLVTGQAGIVEGSVVNAWIRATPTAEHSADEHLVETIKVFAGNIVAGTGFTIYGFNSSEKSEPTGKGTQLYGTFNVQWTWN